jgi:capsular exopolysaccharide synthesis family protein
MSKFFRALETAEKERAAEEEAAAATTGATTVAATAPPAPAARQTIAEPPARATTVAAPPSRTATVAEPAGRAAKPAAPPTPSVFERSRNGATAEALPVEPPPEIAVPRRSETDERVSGRTAGYGAPMARPSRRTGAHGLAFVSGLDSAVEGERGDLDDHLVSLLAPTSFAAEQYRTVRLAIETAHRERGVGVVAVSSPGRSEGKTMTAINVAGALAQAPDARVVLVDADFRHPRISAYLGLHASRGLSTYLLDESLSADDVIERHPGIAFSVVVAGPVSSMPYELLKSPRLGALIQTLRRKYDFVVVDTAPVLLFPDIGLLRDSIDEFVMVVRANRTARQGLSDSLDTLGRERVIGLLFNDAPRGPAARTDDDRDDPWYRSLLKPLGALVD